MVVSRDPKTRLGTLVAPTGERTQSEGETLDLLLLWRGVRYPQLPAAPHMWTGGWLRGSLHIAGWGGRLIHLPHIKVRVWTGFSRPFCKRVGVLIPYLVRILRACLATGYVPALWRQVKVMFIPKLGRSSHC
jgi:hypothetical protein